MLKDTSCCGLKEIDGLSCSPEQTVDELCEELFEEPVSCFIDNPDMAFILFTDAVKYKNGQELARFIQKHDLGTVYGARARTNPNSGNKIKAWIWSPNKRKLKAYYRKYAKHS